MPVELTEIDLGTPDMWASLDFAEDYFANRLHSESWTASSNKAAALVTAQQDLESAPDFTFTDADTETPSIAMRRAVCEQALFRLLDPDMDLRASMQAQRVTVADIVLEEYRSTAPDYVPIAARARRFLHAYENGRNTLSTVRGFRPEGIAT